MFMAQQEIMYNNLALLTSKRVVNAVFIIHMKLFVSSYFLLTCNN